MKNLLNKKRTVVGLIFVITAFVAVFGYSIIGSKTTVHAEIMDSKKAVSSEKEWTVNFNVPVDLNSAKESIEVITANGNTFSSINVSYGEKKSSIKVTPTEPYNYGQTYILKVKEGLQAQNGEFLPNTTSMQFDIETMEPVQTDRFNFSTQYAEIRNGKLYFKGETGEEEPYLFDTEKQEDINEQIYRLAQVLIEDNFYTSVRHLEKSEVNPSRAAIRFAQRPMNIVANNTAFDILIFEHQGYNLAEIDRNNKLSENPDGVIDVNSLWFDYEKVKKETFSQKAYEDKLFESLKVLFPDQAQEIYDYMFHYYVDTMEHPENYEELVEVKTFGEVRLNTLIYNGDASFYYTYLAK